MTGQTRISSGFCQQIAPALNELASEGLIKVMNARFPTTEQGLEALISKPRNAENWNGPYLKKGLPSDPWGAAYLYKNPGRNGGPDVFSLGSDAKPGGDGENADVFN